MFPLSVAALVGLTLVLIAGLAVVYRRSSAPTVWVPRTATILALGASIAISTVVLPAAWADSGAFALLLLGVPVGCCLVALAADLAGLRAAPVTTAAAATALVWSLLTALGLGLYLLVPAVLLAVAAATSWHTHRTPHHTSGDQPTPGGLSPNP